MSGDTPMPTGLGREPRPRGRRTGRRFVLELRPEPASRDRDGVPVVVRLRGLLKVALRRFGLRCVRLWERDV